MGQSKGIRQVAIAILFRCQHILALPQAGVTFSAAPPVWVTVDPSGIASTIIPAVFTTQGHRTTIREPPVSLLSTGTYTISPNGRASTYTGLAPVASATSNDNDAGVFLACTANQGVNEPFCLPRSGSTLRPGHTYYITWSPSYFPPNTPIQIQTTSNASTGFTSPVIPASTGFYAWSIPANFLSSLTPPNPPQYTVTFLISYDDPSTPDTPNDRFNRTGPTVYITPDTNTDTDNPSENNNTSHVNIPAIVIPLAIVFGLSFLAGLCGICYRRHGTVPFVSTLLQKRRSGGGGYGARQSRAERVSGSGSGRQWGVGGNGIGAARGGGGDNKSETGVGVELTDRDSWSPTGTRGIGGEGRRNVFREEVARQARLG